MNQLIAHSVMGWKEIMIYFSFTITLLSAISHFQNNTYSRNVSSVNAPIGSSAFLKSLISMCFDFTVYTLGNWAISFLFMGFDNFDITSNEK